MQRNTYESIVPAPKAEVWKFFSNPENLAKITPPDLGFNITHLPSMGVYPGAIIEYTVTPFLAFPIRWVTEITHVDEGNYFVDEQRFGPYAFWHHQHHFFEAGSEATRMVDILHYEIPLRWVTAPIQQFIVGPKVRQIFDYRSKVIQNFFS
jgi:ligand-binding SRPBCC domain-containing protein